MSVPIATASRKDQIKAVAQVMFREKGYASTSMRGLAAEIGIEPASLYSHYKSKEEILHGICFGIAEEFFKSMKGLQDEGLSPDQKLRNAILAHTTVIRNNADAFAVFLNDWRFLSEPAIGEFREMRKKYENFFRTIISEGVSAGIFIKLDIKFMTLTLFSALNWTYHWFSPSGSMAPKEIGHNLGDLIVGGMLQKNHLK